MTCWKAGEAMIGSSAEVERMTFLETQAMIGLMGVMEMTS